eukprot:scaffold4286_cov127-Alexandrium_tamarense.AAC.1
MRLRLDRGSSVIRHSGDEISSYPSPNKELILVQIDDDSIQKYNHHHHHPRDSRRRHFPNINQCLCMDSSNHYTFLWKNLVLYITPDLRRYGQVVSASMVSESIITPKKKRVSGGKKSSSDRKERRKLNKKPRKVRQWKPNQVEEEEFNSSTALGLLESTKTRTLQVTVENCSIDNCTCTMIDQTPGKKCDGFEACNGANPDNVACGSCNGFGACTNAELALAKTVAMVLVLAIIFLELASVKTVATMNGLVLALLVSQGTFIGQNSCNGKVACRELKGSEIGPNSCLGQNACGDSSGATIGSGSCTGVHACADAIGATIGDKSCIEGAAACVSGSGAVIGDDSCVGEQSCQGSSDSDKLPPTVFTGLIVGNSSCQGLKGNILEDSCNAEKSCYKIEAMISTGSCNAAGACLGVNGYNIGGCSCNTANECKCSLVNESYECDDSSAVFTNAQDEICTSTPSTAPSSATTNNDQWFPDWAGENKGCVKNVGNAPSYMWYNPSMWMFDNLEDCCDTNYPWDLATCLGASAAAGSDKWFVDYSLNKCVKECVGDEPCGGLVDGSWVDLFESQSECCSKKVWWNTKCDA